jgi:hypothetical protein
VSPLSSPSSSPTRSSSHSPRLAMASPRGNSRPISGTTATKPQSYSSLVSTVQAVRFNESRRGTQNSRRRNVSGGGDGFDSISYVERLRQADLAVISPRRSILKAAPVTLQLSPRARRESPPPPPPQSPRNEPNSSDMAAVGENQVTSAPRSAADVITTLPP